MQEGLEAPPEEEDSLLGGLEEGVAHEGVTPRGGGGGGMMLVDEREDLSLASMFASRLGVGGRPPLVERDDDDDDAGLDSMLLADSMTTALKQVRVVLHHLGTGSTWRSYACRGKDG